MVFDAGFHWKLVSDTFFPPKKKATGASAPIAFHTFTPILLFRPMSLRQEQRAQMLTGHNSVEHLIR